MLLWAPACGYQILIFVLNHCRTSADLSGGAPSAAPATQNDTEVLQVLNLPHKLTLRCSCTCRQNETEVLQVPTTPATQKQPASIVLNRRRTSADLSGAAPNAAPAMQNEDEVLQVLHLKNV